MASSGELSYSEGRLGAGERERQVVRTVSNGPRAPGLEVETFSLDTGRPLKGLEHEKTRLEFWKTSHSSVVEAALGRGWGESWEHVVAAVLCAYTGRVIARSRTAGRKR